VTSLRPARPHRPFWLLAVSLLAMVLLAGCGAGISDDPQPMYVPSGGVDARTGTIRVDDIWLDAPQGVAAGGRAWLRLDLANDGLSGDALVGVSTPVARWVTLHHGDRLVRHIALPVGEPADLETTNGIELAGFRHAVKPATWFPVTLRFAHAGVLTVDVAVGPLGSGPPDTTKPEAPATDV
jgi:copper(I)-binding protein